MRWFASARRNALIVLASTALGLLLPVVDNANAAPDCPDAARPGFAVGLTELQQALGDVMGSPLECPRADARGNIIQMTTTGLAVYRPDGMSVFASGEHHWALTDQGLETWTGNWHSGLYPPVTQPPVQSQPEAGQAAPASVEAMTLVRIPLEVPGTALVQDAKGSTYTVVTGGGCPDLIAALGDSIFIRTGGPQTDLILLPQDETCAVVEMNVAAGD
jgi:hypothetical protein